MDVDGVGRHLYQAAKPHPALAQQRLIAQALGQIANADDDGRLTLPGHERSGGLAVEHRAVAAKATMLGRRGWLFRGTSLVDLVPLGQDRSTIVWMAQADRRCSDEVFRPVVTEHADQGEVGEYDAVVDVDVDAVGSDVEQSPVPSFALAQHRFRALANSDVADGDEIAAPALPDQLHAERLGLEERAVEATMAEHDQGIGPQAGTDLLARLCETGLVRGIDERRGAAPE